MSTPRFASKVLVYGFKPYLEYSQNITESIVRSLSARDNLATKVFDVCFDREMFLETLNEVSPAAILGLGQSPGADRLHFERRAVNARSEAGATDEPISASGPPYRLVNWILPETADAVPSDDAGTYVCNFSMYVAGEYCESTGARFAFVHVPPDFEVGRGVEFVESVISVS